MRFGFSAAALVLFSCLVTGTAHSEVELTDDEIAWRASNPAVTIAVDNDFAPINFIEGGQAVGIAVDLLRLIEERSGLDIELTVDRWSVLIDLAMRHQVDGIINADITPARQAQLLYTRPYYRVPQAFVVRDDAPPVTAPKDLADQRVAVLEGTSRIDYLRRHHPGVTIVEASTTLDLFGLVIAGEADVMFSALPVTHHTMTENLVTGLRVSGIFQSDEIDSLHIAVRNDMPHLRAILDKAIADISRGQRLEILARWLPEALLQQPQQDGSEVILSEAERRWLADHPVIRVAGDRAWPPIEFVGEQGAFEGIAVDYLRRIEELVGLHFEFDLESDWAEVVAKLRARQLDVFSAAAETPERREFAIFTEPYLNLQAMIFTRDDEAYVDGLNGLVGRRVAGVKGYAVTEFLRRVAQEVEIVEVADVSSALKAVVSGEVDAYVGSLLVTGYYLRREGISNVMAAGEIPFQISVSIAARSDWPELRSILDKALQAISAQEREAINRRWMGLRISQPPDYALMWRWAMAGILILLLFLGWNWYLQRKTADQRIALKRQNEALAAEVEERRRAEEEARAATELKSRMLANISHELRTPLNAIVGFSELLNGAGSVKVSEQRKADYARHINSAGKHLLELVNDALDLTAAEAGSMPLDEDCVSLNDFLEEVLPLVKGRAEDAGVEIRSARPSEVCTVKVDVRRLRQVVLNLLENAIKFTPAGGHVDISYALKSNGSVAITVADNGLGMTAKQLATAFKAFDRGSDPFVRSSEGVGLGLALCDELISAHGGRIELQSKPAEGTTATIILPSDRTVVTGRRYAS